jgi:hypothetical protein
VRMAGIAHPGRSEDPWGNVAADKATIFQVRVLACQLPDSDM